MTWRRLGNAVAIVVCLGLIALANASVRHPHRYRWYEGRLGEVVSAPPWDIVVEDTILTQKVIAGHVTLTTEHVFLVVRWQATSKGRRAALGAGDVALVTADGVSTRQRGDFGGTASLPAAEPGFTASGFSVFELTEERAAGPARLEVRETMGLFTSYVAAVRVEGLITPATRRVPGVKLPQGVVEARR